MYNSKHNLLIESLLKWSNGIMWGGGIVSGILFLIGGFTMSENNMALGLYIILSAIILILFCSYLSITLEAKATQLELLSSILNKKSESNNLV